MDRQARFIAYLDARRLRAGLVRPSHQGGATLWHRLATGLLVLGITVMPVDVLAAAQNAVSQAAQTPLETRVDKGARTRFLAAEQALARGQRMTFLRLEQALRNYPLYPYLRYADLRQRLSRASDRELEGFLGAYADTPLSPRLRAAWLRSLARQQRWGRFLAVYRPQLADDTLRCRHAQALLAQRGLDAQTAEAIRSLWLTGHSMPAQCDTVFSAWRRQGGLDHDMVWTRIHLAMQAGQTGLARYLGRYLEPGDRGWLDLWRRVRREPQQLIPALSRLAPTTHNSTTHLAAAWILGDGLRRLARDDPAQAVDIWRRPGLATRLSNPQRADIERSIALALAREGDERAAGWRARIRDPQTLHRLRVTHILAALEDGEWENALDGMAELSMEEAGTTRWRYWRARALEATARVDQARALYTELAAERDYYGFLAADRLGQGYHFDNRPLVVRSDAISALNRLPGILRARELHALGRQVDARREWAGVLPRLDRAQLLSAAQLAHQWGWHDRAIATLGRAEYWDDLNMRFPLAYREQVIAAARKQAINPAWAFAVIRQESAFTSDARSRAGALGLMQLLPRTAREVAHRLQMRFSGRQALLDTRTNIRLGVRYLRQVRERFGGHAVLATAAYNAGSRRVRSWQPESRPMPADLWVETIPYAETRDYLRRVLTYTVIYEQRLGLPATSLSARMPVVPPGTTRAAESRQGSDAAGAG